MICSFAHADDNIASSGGGLTNTELRASPVPVSGSFYQATQPVSISGSVPVTGTFWQATQPISGTIGISSLPAIPAGANAIGSVSVSNFPSSQAVTGTFWQATQPVSGPLTDTQLRATAVPVSGTFFQATQPISASSLPLPSGASTETTLSAINTKLPSLMSSAPASDTGQSAIPVRVVSQLGAGGAGGGLTNTELRASAVPVSGTFFQATQPISGTVTANAGTGTMAVSGPLTDTQIRATALPVSGTFFQATQPVSIASMPSTPVTGTFWQATQPVSLASAPSTPVTNVGTFAVQSTLANETTKVIGTVNIAASQTIATTGPLTDTQLRATAVPVSGSFFQATQPISAASLPLPSGASTETTLSALNTKVTAVNTGAVTISAALPTGTNSIGTVIPPTITKGTQGAVGFTTQDLADAGRNARHFMLDAYTVAPAVEAVQSVVQWYGNAAVAATTQPAVVPAGKTLRLISWMISTKSLATVGSAVVRVRVNTAGLGVLASPLAFSFEAGSQSGATTVAMTGGLDTHTGTFPVGFEIPAGSGLAFSMAGYGPAGVLAAQGVTRFQVFGYEY